MCVCVCVLVRACVRVSVPVSVCWCICMCQLHLVLLYRIAGKLRLLTHIAPEMQSVCKEHQWLCTQTDQGGGQRALQQTTLLMSHIVSHGLSDSPKYCARLTWRHLQQCVRACVRA